MAGLLDITVSVEKEEPMITAKENAKTRDFLIKNWMLGPDKTGLPNSEYWRELANVWRIAPVQAKRNLCANCEYFNDSPDTLAKMESVPEDRFDRDGGGRGWCSKWDFICLNLRTCKAWEKGSQPETEDEGYENGNDQSTEND